MASRNNPFAIPKLTIHYGKSQGLVISRTPQQYGVKLYITLITTYMYTKYLMYMWEKNGQLKDQNYVILVHSCGDLCFLFHNFFFAYLIYIHV